MQQIYNFFEKKICFYKINVYICLINKRENTTKSYKLKAQFESKTIKIKEIKRFIPSLKGSCNAINKTFFDDVVPIYLTLIYPLIYSYMQKNP